MVCALGAGGAGGAGGGEGAGFAGGAGTAWGARGAWEFVREFRDRVSIYDFFVFVPKRSFLFVLGRSGVQFLRSAQVSRNSACAAFSYVSVACSSAFAAFSQASAALRSTCAAFSSALRLRAALA